MAWLGRLSWSDMTWWVMLLISSFLFFFSSRRRHTRYWRDWSSDVVLFRREMKLDVGMLTHDLESIPGYARKVEALGYDCLWSAETQHDPFLPLAVAATVTSKIGLGTSIAVAFPRSPMILAHISWDLAKA